jgi:mono/diheme cytochrome c family protein
VKYLASAVAFSIGLLAWCQGGSLVQRASFKAHPLSNPLENNPVAQLAGAKLYQRECAACHGENREGRVRVPPLAQPEVYRAAPGTLFWILRNGSLTTGMPSFAHLPEVQRWQIIAFLTGPTPTSVLTTPGTAARARENFNISALPEDALDEINRIQTRQRFNEVVKTGSLVSFHKVDEHEIQTVPGAVHARGTNTRSSE